MREETVESVGERIEGAGPSLAISQLCSLGCGCGRNIQIPTFHQPN